MSNKEKHIQAAGEHRSYFRVDDVISVVANPVDLDREEAEGFRNNVVSSKAFTLLDVPGPSETDLVQDVPEGREDSRLYSMMTEIKTKLDFLINHFMLDKEGLLQPEKKFVNISASGIRFTLDYSVSVGEIMDIKLLLPTYPPVAVFAYGEVKRVKEIDGNKFEVALEYLNMADSVRNEIIHYTLSHQRETIKKSKEPGPQE